MQLVFLGSPPFATPILGRLLDSIYRPSLVVTPPGRRRGRGRKAEPSPVAQLAVEHGIPVLQPETVKDDAFLEALKATNPDVFFVVSYGELLRQSFLDIPKIVSLNVHPSLLPRHRGATPIPAAILAGDEVTGVSIQRVVLELDAGDVLVAREAAILPGETAGELAGRLAEFSGDLAVEALALAEGDEPPYTPQAQDEITHCKRLAKEDGAIDWTRPSVQLERHVRAMNPWPLARTAMPGGTQLAVHRASVLPLAHERPPGALLSHKERLLVACGEGALELTSVQAPGKRAMPAADFLRGASFDEHTVLGDVR